MSIVGETTLEGWMTLNKSKKYYLVLKRSALVWYPERPTTVKKATKPKGLVEIVPSSVVRIAAVSKPHAIEIVTLGSSIIWCADTKHEGDQWLAAIKASIAKAKVAPRSDVKCRKEGILIKNSTQNKNWRSRYFVLMPGRLVYFDKAPTGWILSPRGMIDIAQNADVKTVMNSSGRKHVFAIESNLISMQFAAESQSQQREWIEKVQINVMFVNEVPESAWPVGHWLRNNRLGALMGKLLKHPDMQNFHSIRDMSDEDLEKITTKARVNRNDARHLQLIVRDLQNMPMGEFVDLYGQPKPKIEEANIRPSLYSRSTMRLEPKRKALLRATIATGRSSFIELESVATATLERRAYCWGNDTDQQLGIGISSSGMAASPQFIKALKHKTEPFRIHAGYQATAAVSAKEGNVFTWGRGPLGTGLDQVTRPAIVPALKKVAIFEVAVGKEHMIAVAEHGAAFSWGDGPKGQLGLGNNNLSTKTPVEIQGITGAVVSATCSPHHSMLLMEDGRVLTMGDGQYGRLGLSDKSNRFVPTVVNNISTVPIDRIACGDNFSLALDANGTDCFWWGELAGRQGPLAPVLFEKFSEKPIDLIVAAAEVAFFVCGSPTEDESDDPDDFLDSSVYSLGSNGLLLGHGTLEGSSSPLPKLVEALEGHGVVSLSCSPTHATALTFDGRLLAWGEDDRGQLGSGYMVNVSRPHETVEIAGYRYVWSSCGVGFTSAIMEYNPEFEDDDDFHNASAGQLLSPPPPPKETIEKAKQLQDDFSNTLDDIARMTHAIEAAGLLEEKDVSSVRSSTRRKRSSNVKRSSSKR